MVVLEEAPRAGGRLDGVLVPGCRMDPALEASFVNELWVRSSGHHGGDHRGALPHSIRGARVGVWNT